MYKEPSIAPLNGLAGNPARGPVPELELPMPADLPGRLDKVASALSRVVHRHPASPRQAGSVPKPAAASSQFEVHDRFFRVRRASGDSSELLAGALATSDLLVADDLATSGTLLEPDPDHLLLGVTWFLTGASPPAAARQPWNPADPFAAAQWRWLIGHQRFFLLLQLLIVGLTELEAVRTPREELGTVHAVAWLCRSTAVAMQYAADFSAALYEEVRDTMTPPAVNEGFSGLQTRDHSALVAQMRRFSNSPSAKRMSPASSDVLHTGFQHLYRAHAHVCDKFGGQNTPSLLMAHTGVRRGSGVEAAENLAEQRLRLIART